MRNILAGMRGAPQPWQPPAAFVALQRQKANGHYIQVSGSCVCGWCFLFNQASICFFSPCGNVIPCCEMCSFQPQMEKRFLMQKITRQNGFPLLRSPCVLSTERFLTCMGIVSTTHHTEALACVVQMMQSCCKLAL